MVESVSSPRPLAAQRSPWLRGPVRLPGDPALTALGLMLAAQARGESVLANAGGNVEAIAAALRALGVHIRLQEKRWHVLGLGTGGLLAPEAPIDLSEAGPGAPLLVALCGAHEMDVAFTGLEALPMTGALLDFLRRNGTRVELDGELVRLRAPRFPPPLDLALSAGARGLIAPLLLHCLALTGTSTLHLPAGVSDPAEALLPRFGARLAATSDGQGTRLRLAGMAPLAPQAVELAGHASLAAYPLVAALITPDSEVTARDVALSPEGIALLEALRLMGADIGVAEAARGVADITARHGRLTGAVIPAALRIAIDDFAILAVAAAFAEGETVLEGFGEGSRRQALLRGLAANGVTAVETPGALVLRGQPRVAGGGNVATRLDPKLAMAFLVLGMATQGPVGIDDGGVMQALFPGFVPAFEHIGASFSGPGAA